MHAQPNRLAGFRRGLLVLFAVPLAGCAVKAHHYLTGTPSPRHQGTVEVFMQGAPLPPHYEEIGVVQVVANRSTHVAKLLPALTREAASLGADAVVLVRVEHGSDDASATGVAVRRSGGDGGHAHAPSNRR